MKNRTLSLLAAGLIGGAATAQAALTWTFDVSDSWIEVGESFSVDVGLAGVDPSYGNLAAFGFVVDPFASLSLFEYQGATVGSLFLDFTDPFNPNDVAGGLLDPFAGTGSDIHLATLNFIAVGVGAEDVDLVGFLADFRGLLFESDDFSVFTDFDVETSLRLASVPEPSTYGLAGAGLFFVLIGLRARRSRRVATAA